MLKILTKRVRTPKSTEIVDSTPVRPTRTKAEYIVPLLPLVRSTHPIEPKVVDRVNCRTSREVRLVIKLYLSRNPHFEFVKIHTSSLSANVKQFLFRRIGSNVVTAKTIEQLEHEGPKYSTVGSGFAGVEKSVVARDAD